MENRKRLNRQLKQDRLLEWIAKIQSKPFRVKQQGKIQEYPYTIGMAIWRIHLATKISINHLLALLNEAVGENKESHDTE